MTKVIEVVYENGVFRPLKRIDLPEGSRLVILIEDFSEVDRISDDVKRIAGETSKGKIIELLGEVWMQST